MHGLSDPSSDLADKPALDVIARSARELSAARTTHPSRSKAHCVARFRRGRSADPGQHYFVAESAGRLVRCGGWSRRRTRFFGGDARKARCGRTGSSTDAAKIRAFFVDPDHARQGIGHALLSKCESEAQASGFSRFELMATPSGVRLYAARGYVPGERIRYPLGVEGQSIEFVPMSSRCPHDFPATVPAGVHRLLCLDGQRRRSVAAGVSEVSCGRRSADRTGG